MLSDKLKQPDKFKLSKFGIPLTKSRGDERSRKLKTWMCLIPRLTKDGVKSLKLGKYWLDLSTCRVAVKPFHTLFLYAASLQRFET